MPSVKYIKKSGIILRQGQYNRERIFHFILESMIHKIPVTKTTIRNGLRDDKGKPLELSRPTIDLHLDELIREDRINRTGRKYFAKNSFLNDLLSFSHSMSDIQPRMIDKSVIELELQQEPYRSIPSSFTYNPLVDTLSLYERPTPNDYFVKRVSGISLSKKVLSRTFLDKNVQAKLLFEYVNRIGVYIAYIFIQALIPSQQRIMRKDEAVNSFIRSSIDLERMFGSFRRLITQAGLTHIISDDLQKEFQKYENMWELDRERFEKLSRLFRTLYPSIYDGLENFWQHSNIFWRKHDESISIDKSCKHAWREHELFKLGLHYRCAKCRLIITDAFYKENFIHKNNYSRLG